MTPEGRRRSRRQSCCHGRRSTADRSPLTKARWPSDQAHALRRNQSRPPFQQGRPCLTPTAKAERERRADPPTRRTRSNGPLTRRPQCIDETLALFRTQERFRHATMTRRGRSNDSGRSQNRRAIRRAAQPDSSQNAPHVQRRSATRSSKVGPDSVDALRDSAAKTT